MSTSTATPATLTTWNLDPAHSTAQFKVKHMMISNVKGNFTGLSGVLKFNPADPTGSSVEASIDVTTVNTSDAQRDGHLKSADFFDTEKFPAITFKSTKVASNGGSDYAVTGDLTLLGVTKSVVFSVEEVSEPAKDPWGNLRIGLAASTKINRKDFGVSFNQVLDAGGLALSEKVDIVLEVQAGKA